MNESGDTDRSGGAGQPVHVTPTQILATLDRARELAVSDAVQNTVSGQVVKVVGSAAPGPGGPLHAPLSGAECVWYRSLVLRGPRPTRVAPAPLRPMHAFAPSDLPSYGADTRANLWGDRLGTDTSSSAPFAVSDGASSLVIDPRTSDIDSDIFGINQVVPREPASRSRTFGPDEIHCEWIIPVGAEVLALGTVRQTGRGRTDLVAGGEGIVLVSTKPEERIRSRNHAALEHHLPFSNPRTVKLFLFGFMLVAMIIIAVILMLTVVKT